AVRRAETYRHASNVGRHSGASHWFGGDMTRHLQTRRSRSTRATSRAPTRRRCASAPTGLSMLQARLSRCATRDRPQRWKGFLRSAYAEALLALGVLLVRRELLALEL